MSDYVRPFVEPMTFRDAAGNVIDYGNRWRGRDGPPEDSYSVDENLERFAPLHTIAEALIEHLVADRDVIVDEGEHVLSDLRHTPPASVIRAVRLTPGDRRCASLTFVLTDYPGVHVHAGVLFGNRYPPCGCNACDETWENGAEELENQTLAIVDGGFTEQVSPPRRPRWSYDRGRGLVKGMGRTVTYRLEGSAWSRGGESRAEDVPADVLEQAVARLDELRSLGVDGAWMPWPKRGGVPA